MAVQIRGSRLPVRDTRKFEERCPRLIVLLLLLFSHMLVHGRVPTRFGFGIIIGLPTGVDLSKILGGKKVIKVINAWAFLNYWRACARAARLPRLRL